MKCKIKEAFKGHSKSRYDKMVLAAGSQAAHSGNFAAERYDRQESSQNSCLGLIPSTTDLLISM